MQDSFLMAIELTVSPSLKCLLRAEGALRSPRELMQWCWNYFTDEGHSGAGPPVETRGGEPRGGGLCGDPVVVSRKPPLYIQHEGHSRTLVGVELRQPRPGAPAEVSLIILDPSQPTQPLLSALRERRHWQARLRPLHLMSALDGQHGWYKLSICSCNGNLQWP